MAENQNSTAKPFLQIHSRFHNPYNIAILLSKPDIENPA